MNLKHLEQRSNERLESLLENKVESSGPALADLFLHSSDVGVMRNGGRNGARFAPQAVLSILKKLAWHGPWNQKINVHSYNAEAAESKNFNQAQIQETANLAVALNTSTCSIQIGGGHDHIYPYLKAISSLHQKIICLNIDAHCDTRTDDEMHSGTPFRQFAKLGVCDFELWQIGIHSWANSVSTVSEVHGAKVRHYPSPLSVTFWTELEKYLGSLPPDVAVVFSLDLDALEAGVMEGVSAVNHQGLSSNEVGHILDLVLQKSKNKKFFGFYEYNPLYDNLSQKGARYIASLIYKIISQQK